MISKSEIKFITSLRQKKYRDKHQLFFAEGPKVVHELVDSGYRLHSYFTVDSDDAEDGDKQLISLKELQRISLLKSPNTCLAVFHMRESSKPKESGLMVALDAVRDPGNLGTIIRLCDWFGIEQLICSEDTADCYNPKVVQSTMGSLGRVSIHYTDLAEYLKGSHQRIYGAVMEGDDLYSTDLIENAIVVLGNESNGISEEVESVLHERITIPRYGKQQKTESLNVAMAAAILLGEFRRATGK